MFGELQVDIGRSVSYLADQLGMRKAATALARRSEDEVRDELVTHGDGVYEGTMFRVTIVTTDKRVTNAERFANLLAARGVDPALIAQAAIDASEVREVTNVRAVAKKKA